MTAFNSTSFLRKFISLLMILSLLVCVVCMGGFSASAADSDNTKTHGYFEYVVEDGSVCITGYTGKGGDVSIPNTIEDMEVVAIGEEAFWYEDKVTAVDFPDELIFIGARAFQGCKSLMSVSLPDSVIEIGDAAFCDCTGLVSANVPLELKYVGGAAFDNTPWITRFEDNTSIIFGGKVFYKYLGDAEVVTIPEGITGISSNAFTDNQTLTYVSIPESVVFIGDYSFFNCPNLKSACVPDGAYYMGAYSFGYNTVTEDGGEKVEDFVLYANEDTLGADYAKEYELECKPLSEHKAPEDLPEAETCVAKDYVVADKNSGGTWFQNQNSLVAFLLIVVSSVGIIGGLSLYFGIREKKLKQAKKEEMKAKKGKKSKKKK